MSVFDYVKSFINIAWDIICRPLDFGGMTFSFGGFLILSVALILVVKLLSFWLDGGD